MRKMSNGWHVPDDDKKITFVLSNDTDMLNPSYEGKYREQMRQHLIGFYSIGPLPRAQRASELMMIGPREYDPMRVMLGIPTSEEAGTL